MPLRIEKIEDGLVVVRVAGRPSQAEVGARLAQCELAIDRFGEICLLSILDQFEGIEPYADWGTLNLPGSHDEDIEGIAVIGEVCWREPVSRCLARRFGTVDVAYFTPDEADLAWRLVG